MAPREVLDFWFGTLTDKQHFARDGVVDREIGERFADVHAVLSDGVPPEWRGEPESLLAAIIVLDQFSRNLFRDDSRAYAQDAAALLLTDEAIAKDWDKALTPEQRQFLYMPLMHSEDLVEVERCAALMAASDIDQGRDFAERHAAVIRRFGRYPARNAALGRETTSAEAAFLQSSPMGF